MCLAISTKVGQSSIPPYNKYVPQKYFFHSIAFQSLLVKKFPISLTVSCCDEMKINITAHEYIMGIQRFAKEIYNKNRAAALASLQHSPCLFLRKRMDGN